MGIDETAAQMWSERAAELARQAADLRTAHDPKGAEELEHAAAQCRRAAEYAANGYRALFEAADPAEGLEPVAAELPSPAEHAAYCRQRAVIKACDAERWTKVAGAYLASAALAAQEARDYLAAAEVADAVAEGRPFTLERGLNYYAEGYAGGNPAAE